MLTNAIDGWAGVWVDGSIHILRAYAQNGAPTRKVKDWSGRWWTLWGAVDLLPMGDKVMAAGPGFLNPLLDAGEIEITGRNTGRIALANGYGSHGEPVRCVRAKSQDRRDLARRHQAAAGGQGGTRDGSALRETRLEFTKSAR